VERAGEVRAQHPVPLLVAHAGDEPVVGDASVVDEQLDRPERLLDLFERGVDGVGVADVGAHRERVGAGRLDGCLRLLRALLVGGVAEGDPVSVLGERDRSRAADAARRAGDERDPGAHADRLPHRTSALPHVMPAPKPDMRTRSSGERRPSSCASVNASGIDAADVLP